MIVLSTQIKLFVISASGGQNDRLKNKHRKSLRNHEIRYYVVKVSSTLKDLDQRLCNLKPELIVVGDISFTYFNQRILYAQYLLTAPDWGNPQIIFDGNFPFSPKNDGHRPKL